MRQDLTTRRTAREDYGPDGGVMVMTSYTYRESGPAAPVEPAPYTYSRYTDQPMDWRTRLVGVSGTGGVFLAIAAVSLITWQVVQPLAAPSALTVVNLQSFEAPPEPMREVPEGPEQVQQEEQKLREQERLDPVPEIVMPRLSPVTQPMPPPVEQSAAVDPVPETTAPKSVAAPRSNRASSDAEATWQALLLAHLEKHRRYPARARAARQQGVVNVTFRMNRVGMVLSSSVLRSSGFSALDQAALDTLHRAQPLPRIPDDRPDIVELTLPVEFFVRR